MEAINHYRSRVERALSNVESLKTQTADLAIKIKIPDVDNKEVLENSVKSYERIMRSKLIENSIKLLPLPRIGHREFIKSALRGSKPFSASGHEGYRDALIWSSIKKEIREDDAVLITNNTTDFCSPENREEIHKELIVDKKHAPYRVYESIRNFVETVVAPIDQALQTFNAKLSDIVFSAELFHKLSSAIEGRYLGDPLRLECVAEAYPDIPELQRTMYDCQVLFATVVSISALKAVDFGNKQVIIDVEAETLCDVDVLGAPLLSSTTVEHKIAINCDVIYDTRQCKILDVEPSFP